MPMPLRSCIQSERDGRGYLVLHWHPFSDRKFCWSRRRGAFERLFFLSFVALPVQLLLGAIAFALLPGLAGNNDATESTGFFALVVGLIGWGYLGCWRTAVGFLDVLRRPTPEKIVFAGDVLEHQPGCLSDGQSVYTGSESAIHCKSVKRIRLSRNASRQMLLVEHEAGQTSIGNALREPEREWLARLLCDWAGYPKENLDGASASGGMEPCPHAIVAGDSAQSSRSGIAVERDASGQLRLKWDGARRPYRLVQYVEKGLLISGIAIWIVVALPVAAFSVLTILSGWRVGWEVLVGMSLVGPALCFLYFWIRSGREIFEGSWQLLRGRSPESISLTATALKHDPGCYLIPARDLFRIRHGPMREIPRDEIGEIRVEQLSSERCRLTIDYGIERVEIAPNLGDGEYCWLAGILRDWADGRPVEQLQHHENPNE